MEYKKLGLSSLNISRIGFGCMSLDLNQTGNADLLNRAVDHGINFFDTADLYEKGMNEELVGKSLKPKRNQIYLASKVGNQWKKDGTGWDWNPRKKYILEAVENSLRRLQTDYIDLYQLHGGTIQDPIEETIEAFERLVESGKIRYYGISSIRPNVIREWIKRSRIISVMMQYSLLDRRPEELTDYFKENKIGILARGTLARGILCGKKAKPVTGHTREEVVDIQDLVKEISNKGKRTAVQTSIQFVLREPSVVSSIAGIRTMEQLEEAVNTIEAERMTDKEMEILQRSVKAFTYTEHR